MHTTINRKLEYVFHGLVVCLFLLLLPASLKAQAVLGAQNTALGGGGTAYLDGYKATLWNPANLVIRDRPGNWHFGLGHTGILYEPVLSTGVAGDQYFNFTDTYFPYRINSADITTAQREAILDNNYAGGELVSQHQTRAEVVLGGALWQGDGKAYSLVARARFASRIEVGRGWYSDAFVDAGDRQVRDLTLHHQRNHLYELSFGYAREFTFINGLFPQINKLYVGIAPKVVLAGPSLDLAYSARYLRSEEGANTVFSRKFSYRSTGNYSRGTLAYRSGLGPQQAIREHFDRRLGIDNTGYGAGVDFGLTYVIPLGDDLSTIARNSESAIVDKSIRIAFSVNDVGIVRYDGNPLRLSAPRDTTTQAVESVSRSMFIGADGQYLSFFNDLGQLPNPINADGNPKTGSYTTLLPTSINAGLLLELSTFRLMGDLTLGLNNTAFNTTKLAFHLGLEARPIQKVPLRFGTRLAAGLPTRLGIGTGFESRYWDFNIGTQILIRSRTLTSEMVGGAFAGIQLHL